MSTFRLHDLKELEAEFRQALSGLEDVRRAGHADIEAVYQTGLAELDSLYRRRLAELELEAPKQATTRPMDVEPTDLKEEKPCVHCGAVGPVVGLTFFEGRLSPVCLRCTWARVSPAMRRTMERLGAAPTGRGAPVRFSPTRP